MREQAVEAALDADALDARGDALDAPRPRPRARSSRAQGVADASASACSARCTCATRAPTPRCRSRCRRRSSRCAPRSRRRTAQRFGFVMPGKAAGRRGGRGRGDRRGDGRARDAAPPFAPSAAAARSRSTRVAMFTGGAWHDAPVYRPRRARGRATAIDGPAIIVEANATTVVEPGWQARGRRRATTSARRASTPRRRAHAIGTDGRSGACWRCSTTSSCRSPSRWASRSQNTAYSVNIKERLDFSCALFDADGGLIANAPHMPVHLGSMGESVQTVIARSGAAAMRAGRRLRAQRALQRRHASARRHRDHAGLRRGRRDDILFFVAVARPPRRYRRHHARARCRPTRRTVEEEGVLHRQLSCWSTAGASARRRLRALLASGRYPARNPDQNIADLQGPGRRQREGRARSCARWSAHFGLDVVHAYMRPRAGQRRGGGAPRASTRCRTARSPTRWTTARAIRGARSRSTARRARR